MTPVRVLIADDEPLARERLAMLLADRPGSEVIGEARDGEETVQRISADRPDLVFLDVQMPELDGFTALEAALSWHVPEVVFVTAYDSYAIRAFEAGATDYLLKPFDRQRFEVALARALARVASPAGEESVRAFLAGVRRERGGPERIAVTAGKRIRLVDVSTIDWIEAAGNYARLRSGGTVHVLRESMRELERRLDPSQFVRVHRSVIVRIGAIAELEPCGHGEYRILLPDGTEVTRSRTFGGRLRGVLK